MVTETYNHEVKLTLTSQGIDALTADIITVIMDEIEHRYTFREFFERLGIE